MGSTGEGREGGAAGDLLQHSTRGGTEDLDLGEEKKKEGECGN